MCLAFRRKRGSGKSRPNINWIERFASSSKPKALHRNKLPVSLSDALGRPMSENLVFLRLSLFILYAPPSGAFKGRAKGRSNGAARGAIGDPSKLITSRNHKGNVLYFLSESRKTSRKREYVYQREMLFCEKRSFSLAEKHGVLRAVGSGRTASKNQRRTRRSATGEPPCF